MILVCCGGSNGSILILVGVLMVVVVVVEVHKVTGEYCSVLGVLIIYSITFRRRPISSRIT